MGGDTPTGKGHQVVDIVAAEGQNFFASSRIPHFSGVAGTPVASCWREIRFSALLLRGWKKDHPSIRLS